MQSLLNTAFSLKHTSYWVLIIWWIGFGPVLKLFPKEQLLIRGRVSRRWYAPAAVLLLLPYILWAGFRGDFADTGTYIQHFQNMPSALSALPDVAASYGDWGFYCLMVILKSLGVQSHETFFLILAAFHVWCMVYTFRRYASDFWISFFLFIASTDYMSWMHNGIRQFTAVCITFAAFDLLVRQRYLSFVLVTLIASAFHGSALLMLPFAWVMVGPALNWKSLLLLGGAVLMLPLADRLTPVLGWLLSGTRYRSMVSGELWAKDDGTNLLRVLVYSVPALVSLMGRRYIRGSKNRAVNLCVNASLVTTAVYLVSAVTSGIYIGRIPIYTTLHGYMVLPWLIDQVFEDRSAQMLKVLLVVFYLAFFRIQMGRWALI